MILFGPVIHWRPYCCKDLMIPRLHLVHDPDAI